MINREARARREALDMCCRVRSRGYCANRRLLYGGSTAAFNDREQRVKSHAIHLLTRAGVLRLDVGGLRPACRCGGCREKRYIVNCDKLDAYLEGQ